jgi:hypothetical protein
MSISLEFEISSSVRTALHVSVSQVIKGCAARHCCDELDITEKSNQVLNDHIRWQTFNVRVCNLDSLAAIAFLKDLAGDFTHNDIRSQIEVTRLAIFTQ